LSHSHIGNSKNRNKIRALKFKKDEATKSKENLKKTSAPSSSKFYKIESSGKNWIDYKKCILVSVHKKK